MIATELTDTAWLETEKIFHLIDCFEFDEIQSHIAACGLRDNSEQTLFDDWSYYGIVSPSRMREYYPDFDICPDCERFWIMKELGQ